MESNDTHNYDKRCESISAQQTQCTIPPNFLPAPIVDEFMSIDRVEEHVLEDLVSKATLVEASAFPKLSKLRTIMIIVSLTAVTFTSSMSTGLVTISIPRIARDLNLANHLILW